MYFEWDESEIAACIWEQGNLQLRFAAAKLIEGEGAHAQVLWAPLQVVANGVEPWESVEASACMGRLRQGVVLHASQRLRRLPVPCTLQGVVTMELEFAQGAVMHVRCEGLEVRAVQAPAVQAYQC